MSDGTIRSPLRENADLKGKIAVISVCKNYKNHGKEEFNLQSNPLKFVEGDGNTAIAAKTDTTTARDDGEPLGDGTPGQPEQIKSKDDFQETKDFASAGTTEERFEGQRSKRNRKSVDRLTVDQQVSKKQSEILPGTGTPLRNIPNVSYKLSKITGKNEIMEALHLLMYRRKGAAQSRKKHVLDFNGLSFPDMESTRREIESRINTLSKMNVSLIHDLLDVLDIKRGRGDKQSKIELLISFLEKPTQLSDLNLEEKDVAKKEKMKRKRASQLMKTSASRNPRLAPDSKSLTEATIHRFMDNENKEEPADMIPLSQIKKEIHSMLEAMTTEEFTTVTTKMIMTKLSMVFQCDMRPRKGKVKEIAKAYAQHRLS